MILKRISRYAALIMAAALAASAFSVNGRKQLETT